MNSTDITFFSIIKIGIERFEHLIIKIKIKMNMCHLLLSCAYVVQFV